MIKGLYAAATGMTAIEARQAVTANNIANAATPGFRRQEPLVKGFYDVFLEEMGSVGRYNNRVGPGGGVMLEQTFTDTQNGAVSLTGDPMHVGLEGPGFLVVQTENGERFTRNGKFAPDVQGELATPDGLKVMGQGGPIDVSGGGDIEFGEDGTVYVGGQERGRLQLVEFENPNGLERQGENLYYANDDALEQSADSENTRVMGRSLELSNVKLPIEMSNMMMGLRAYTANQRVVTTLSETMDRVIGQVGTPSG